MIEVECKEITLDEQLALASAITEGLEGKGVALVNDTSVVIDSISKVDFADVLNVVKSFISRRKDTGLYSLDTVRDSIIVRSPDPLAKSRGRKDPGQILPPNVLKCPYCGFVTQFEEAYTVHVRAHGGILH